MLVIIRGIEKESASFLRVINMGKSEDATLARKIIYEYFIKRFKLTIEEDGKITFNGGEVVIDCVRNNYVINGMLYKTKLKEYRAPKEEKKE